MIPADRIEDLILRISKLSRAKQEYLLGFVEHLEKEAKERRKVLKERPA